MLEYSYAISLQGRILAEDRHEAKACVNELMRSLDLPADMTIEFEAVTVEQSTKIELKTNE